MSIPSLEFMQFTPSSLLAATRRSVVLLALAAAGCLATTDLNAQIVTWEFDGIDSGSNLPRPATTLDSNLASATIGHGAGVAITGPSGTIAGGNMSSTSLANAITDDKYLRFTLTPSANGQFSVSSLTVYFSTNSGSTHTAVLMSSATGFTSSSGLWNGSVAGSSSSTYSIDLSAVSALQNVSSATEFRFYSFGADGQLRIFNSAGTDLAVFGTTAAVPEPSTYAALAGLAVFGLVVLRRRRR